MSEAIQGQSKEKLPKSKEKAIRASVLWAEILSDARDNQSPVENIFRLRSGIQGQNNELAEILSATYVDGEITPVELYYNILCNRGTTENDLVKEMEEVLAYLERVRNPI